MGEFVVFESIESKRKKKYLVTVKAIPRLTLCKSAKRFFHCSVEHIEICEGFIYKGHLYSENPHKKGVTSVWVAYYV